MAKKNNINIGEIIRKIIARKKLMIRNLVIAAVVFGGLIMCVPRTYTCEVTMAPEFGNTSPNGSLASIASSFGVNLGNDVQTDAISPSLYPDLLESKQFIVSLFPVRVKSQDGLIDTDYYTYLSKYQKSPWWKSLSKWLKNTIKGIFSKPKPKDKGNYKKANPFRLTEEQYNMAEKITGRINCSVDRRSYVITILVTDQDPLIAASIADTVRVRLQKYITDYRTSKARGDLEYYTKLYNEAKQEYERTMKEYSAYADSHRDMILQTFISQRDKLETAMQMAFNVYTALSQQLETAKAKVQECTPAFTTLKCASVPVKPSGPKRVMFVLGMLILTFIATAYYIVKVDKRS
ncbi:MAG: chain-length determining protein [Bacteroidaceae bacterium]|nr:chain-length determining protein [Bacteroidaceae bacterium]